MHYKTRLREISDRLDVLGAEIRRDDALRDHDSLAKHCQEVVDLHREAQEVRRKLADYPHH